MLVLGFREQCLITQLLVVPSPPHSLVYYFALLADLCSEEKIQPSVSVHTRRGAVLWPPLTRSVVRARLRLGWCF